MKKSILSIILTLLICIPSVFAANWVQYDEKKYLDTESINNESYNKYYNMYSIWTKHLNDGSENFKNMENVLKKKVWYTMNKQTFDCDRKIFRVDSVIVYDLQKNAILHDDSYTSYTAVVPESKGEYLYSYVCTHRTNNIPTFNTKTNYIPSQDGSNIRIKVKHRR